MKDWDVTDLVEWHRSKSTTAKSTLSPKPKKHPCDYETFVNQLLKQSRLLSQLIASSWLDGDRAKQIREIFNKATGHDDSELRQLLTGKKPNLWEQCIFDDDEIDLYEFKISWNSFKGKLNENAQAVMSQTPPYFTMTLPYPPRPALGEFTVTYDQIEEWATSTIEEENGVIKNPFPSYPYIPCSSC